MDPVGFEIKKMAQLYGSLDDPEKLKSRSFYEQLTGKKLSDEAVKSGKKVELERVIPRLQKSIEKSLEAVALSTQGNSLHLVTDKRNLVRILDSISNDLNKLRKNIAPKISNFGGEDKICEYNRLTVLIFKTQEIVKNKIKEIELKSDFLFEDALNKIKEEVDLRILQLNDAYLVKAMGLQENLTVLACHEKSVGTNSKAKARAIHEIVNNQLKKQTTQQLKSIARPSQLKSHITNLTNLLQEQINNFANNKLYCDLSDAAKMEKINAVLSNYVRVDERLQINQTILQENTKKIFLEPFEDKAKAEKTLFSHKPLSMLRLIKKIVSFIKSYLIRELLIKKKTKEIQGIIHDSIKKYYGKSNSVDREHLFQNSQIVANDLIRELGNQCESVEIQDKEILSPLFSERNLRNWVNSELTRQLSFNSRRNDKLKFFKVVRDINFVLTEKTKELKQEKEILKPLLDFKKSEILLNAYNLIISHLKNKEFLSALKSIPICVENKELLTTLWKYMLRDAYPDKKMGQKEMLPHYRDYLMIKDHLPTELKEELELFALDSIEIIHKGSAIRLLVESNDKTLTKEEKENIEILAVALEGTALSKTQELKIREFISSITGNIRVNKLAGEMIEKKNGNLHELISSINIYIRNIRNPGPFSKKINGYLEKIIAILAVTPPKALTEKEKNAVHFLRYFSWKTRNLDIPEKIFQKFSNNLKLFEEKKDIPNDQKLTLKEYSQLRSVVNLRDYINSIKNNSIKDIISKNEVFNKKVIELAKKIEESQVQLEKLYTPDADRIYKSGDITAQDSDKYVQLFDSRKNLQDKLRRTFVSKYQHGAVIIKGDESQLLLSHFTQLHHCYENFNSNDSLVNDIWRLDPSQLLEGETLRYMIEMYQAEGKTNWREAIQNEYSLIANDIHFNIFSGHINNFVKQLRAGVEDYIPGGHKGKKITNWKEKVKKKLIIPHLILREFKEELWFPILDAMKISHAKKIEKKKIICSSFVTQATILSLAELNESLAKKLSLYFKRKKNIALSTEFEKKKEVFTMPYPDDLKLGTVHPGMMIDLLLKKKCLTKVESPKVLKEIFRS